jgi:hypothetical protein
VGNDKGFQPAWGAREPPSRFQTGASAAVGEICGFRDHGHGVRASRQEHPRALIACKAESIRPSCASPPASTVSFGYHPPWGRREPRRPGVAPVSSFIRSVQKLASQCRPSGCLPTPSARRFQNPARRLSHAALALKSLRPCRRPGSVGIPRSARRIQGS